MLCPGGHELSFNDGCAGGRVARSLSAIGYAARRRIHEASIPSATRPIGSVAMLWSACANSFAGVAHGQPASGVDA